jgi:hypothetical protein
MAKSNSIIDLQGTFAGLTFVKSRTYGDHVRAKRGTQKRAKVNKAFEQESKTLLSANVPAKIFKDAIDPYRDRKGGLLWQRLVSLFRKQHKDQGSFDFSKIERFEVDTDYPFERLLHVQPTIKSEKEKSILHVDIRYASHPRFLKSKYTDGYRLTVIGLFPDLKKKTAKTVAVASKVIALNGVIKPLQTQLDVPPKAKSFIVCIKIEGCTKGEMSNTRTTNGLCVIGSGEV